MKAFRFPLESLRTLRQQREQATQQHYARTLTLCDGAARVLQLAEMELLTGHALLQSELATGASAARIINLQTWCKVLELRRNECAAVLQAARTEASEAFRALTAAARDREALDKFHEKSLRAWERTLLSAEQKMFDELAIQNAGGPLWQTAFSN